MASARRAEGLLKTHKTDQRNSGVVRVAEVEKGDDEILEPF